MKTNPYFCQEVKKETTMYPDTFKEKYMNPYTDFGFKTLFGTPVNKDLLISFLNSLLHEEQHIVDITYLNAEHLGTFESERKAVFDVYCENDKGEKFIVEMQKAAQRFFKDRSVFYATFPIREQAKRGDWQFELKAVYTIGILNFIFDEGRGNEDYYHHEIKLMDIHTKQVFFDKLNFIYLEMPKFRKTADELVTMHDKWMFTLRNLSSLLERPAALQERVFKKLFRAAEIARFTPQQASEYEESLKIYRDLNNVIYTAEWKGYEKGKVEGLEEGRMKGLREIAAKLKQNGQKLAAIAELTGLSEKEIEQL